MAMRPKRGKVKPKDEAVQFVTWGKDKNGFDVKLINSFKGQCQNRGFAISVHLIVGHCGLIIMEDRSCLN